MKKHFLEIGMILLLFVAQCGGILAKTPLPPPKHGGVYVIAHRGAHRGIPENSLPAYRKAVELGVDFVEVDVRTTRDGVLVSCHNSDVAKYARGLSGKVHTFTLAQLKKIDIGSRVGTRWKGTHIPTMDSVFQVVQGRCGIYLDLKETPIRRVGMFKKLNRLCPECLAMADLGTDSISGEKAASKVAVSWVTNLRMMPRKTKKSTEISRMNDCRFLQAVCDHPTNHYRES